MKGKNTQSLPPLKHQNKIITDHEEKATIINKLFVSQTYFDKKEKVIPLLKMKTIECLDSVICIRLEEVRDILKTLDKTKATKLKPRYDFTIYFK